MDKEKLSEVLVSYFGTDNEYEMDDMQRVGLEDLMNWINHQNPTDEEILAATKRH